MRRGCRASSQSFFSAVLLEAPGAVDFGVLLEVEVEGLARDVDWRNALGCQCLAGALVEAETAQVGREVEGAARGEEVEGAREEGQVVALDIEGAAHGLGLGEGGRVEKNQVEALARATGGGLVQPAEDIHAQEGVAGACRQRRGLRCASRRGAIE